MSSWDKFNQTSLPSKEAFYSNLNMSDISNQDYSHAQNLWKGFGMKNLGKYHDLYLKTDVILPSNVFQAFRSTSLKHFPSIWLISIRLLDWLGKLVWSVWVLS